MHHLKFFDHISQKKRESDIPLHFNTINLMKLLSADDFKQLESFPAYLKILNSNTFNCSIYSDQTLVIIQTNLKHSSSMDYIMNNLSCIIQIVLIERSPTTQAYAVGVLDLSPHCTLLTIDLGSFLYALHYFKRSNTHVIFISSNVSFTSEDKSIKVVNGQPDAVPILNVIHSKMIEMFKHGLGNKFTFNDFGRGDVLKDVDSSTLNTKPTLNDRSIPTISIGFGTQDCNRYSSNRMTLAGNNKPYISNGGLSVELCNEFFSLVTKVLEDDVGKDAFNVDGLSAIEAKFRRGLHKEFANFITQKDVGVEDLNKFRIEGSTGIIGQRLALHCDSENSKVIQMNNAIGLTTNIPMSILTSSEEGSKRDKHINLRKVLLDRGYKDNESFPYSNILYSKSPIDAQVDKLVALDNIKKKNDFNDIMIWALTERIQDSVDYRGTFIDSDDNFSTLFQTKLEQQGFQPTKEGTGELINKPFLASVAAYDKTGYWSINFDFWNSLLANVIPKTNIWHVVQFSLYVGGVCNGTAVPWRLMEEIMKDPVVSRKRLIDEFNNNVFDFLKVIDEEVADFQLQEYYSSISKTGKSKVKRTRGSCSNCRYQYQKSSKDISAPDSTVSTIVNAINEAYFTSSSKKLRSPAKQNTPVDNTKKKKKSQAKVVEPYEYVVKTIENSVKGVGDLTAQFVMNSICGCGGAPLRSYNEAFVPDQWTSNTGPVNILKRALDLPDKISDVIKELNNGQSDLDENERERIKLIMKKTPREYYSDLYSDLKEIFKGGQITMNILENIGCELWRSFSNTCSKTFDLSREQYDSLSVSIVKKPLD